MAAAPGLKARDSETATPAAVCPIARQPGYRVSPLCPEGNTFAFRKVRCIEIACLSAAAGRSTASAARAGGVETGASVFACATPKNSLSYILQLHLGR
jgi:hypothetical protein